jgi:hypothetical protein
VERGKNEKRHVLLPDPAMATGDEKVDLSEPGAASGPDPSRRAKRAVGDRHDFPGHSFTDEDNSLPEWHLNRHLTENSDRRSRTRWCLMTNYFYFATSHAAETDVEWQPFRIRKEIQH